MKRQGLAEVFKALPKPGAIGGVCGCGVAVGCRPTSLEADGVSSGGLAGETRTKGFALAGTAPHPPRSLSRPLGDAGAGMITSRCSERTKPCNTYLIGTHIRNPATYANTKLLSGKQRRVFATRAI